MPHTKVAITPRVTALSTSPYQLNADLLGAILATLPPLVADAPQAWHRTRRRWVSKEIMTLQPTDAVQASLAGEIVTSRHLAAHLLELADRRGATPAQVVMVQRTAAKLLRTSEMLVRALRRRQKAGGPAGYVCRTDHIDVAALAAWWGRSSEARPGGGGGGWDAALTRAAA